MPVIRSSLFFMIRKFPASRDRLHRQYVSRSSFRQLCDDYTLCCKTLAYWKRYGSDLGHERCHEYKELQVALEKEIKTILANGRGDGKERT